MNEWKWNTNPIKQCTVNEIGDKGAIAISESLKTNSTLTKLDLGGDDKIIKITINKWKKWNKIQIQ